jgi:preprotein translocase subunit SecG
MLAYYAIVTVHVLVCFILILVVLLQSGKGADLAGAFGGGATQTAFGSRGPASFLSKVTTGAAILFMITSIALSGMRTSSASRSVLETTGQSTAPVQTTPSQKAPAGKSDAKVLTPEEIKKQQAEIEARQQKQAAEPPASEVGKELPGSGKKDEPVKKDPV